MTWPVWMLMLYIAVSGLMVWSWLFMAAHTEEWQDRLAEQAAVRDALARATEAAAGEARQQPSLNERSLVDVPGRDDCVRCYGPLDDGRNAICTDCWKD